MGPCCKDYGDGNYGLGREGVGHVGVFGLSGFRVGGLDPGDGESVVRVGRGGDLGKVVENRGKVGEKVVWRYGLWSQGRAG